MADTYPIVWDQDTERLYETGVKKCVLYKKEDEVDNKPYAKGVAWNGITSIQESPDGADTEDLYADDIKYLSLRALEEFGGSISAYTYPDEFAQCDGSASLIAGVFVGQQTRKVFGLCYRTAVGNDTEYDDYGYKLHLVYGATCSPSDREYASINDSPEAIEFSWDFKTTPVSVGTVNGVTYKNTSIVTIDTTKLDTATKAKLTKLEDILYGKGNIAPRLPLPAEVYSILTTTGT